jgi:hypothetical protein
MLRLPAAAPPSFRLGAEWPLNNPLTIPSISAAKRAQRAQPNPHDRRIPAADPLIIDFSE